MLFNSLFLLASSILSLTISIPFTSLNRSENKMPNIPTPQYKSYKK